MAVAGNNVADYKVLYKPMSWFSIVVSQLFQRFFLTDCFLKHTLERMIKYIGIKQLNETEINLKEHTEKSTKSINCDDTRLCITLRQSKSY